MMVTDCLFDMNTNIKDKAPSGATHYDTKNLVYVAIDNGTWYFDGDWIQYDKPHNLELMEL